MKEFVEKLIERLEEERHPEILGGWPSIRIERAIEIVNRLAEEYNNYSSDDLISRKLLIEKMWEKHKETEEMFDICVDEIKDVFCGIVAMIDELPTAYNQDSTKNNQRWIPCSERLPDDCDNRFYMCIVENHEEDVPMFCQYCEDHGFGFWHDFYDEHTLGFLDSEFKTNEELGYEKVIAWQPLPEPYKPEPQKEIPTKHYEERFNRVM